MSTNSAQTYSRIRREAFRFTQMDLAMSFAMRTDDLHVVLGDCPEILVVPLAQATWLVRHGYEMVA